MVRRGDLKAAAHGQRHRIKHGSEAESQGHCGCFVAAEERWQCGCSVAIIKWGHGKSPVEEW